MAVATLEQTILHDLDEASERLVETLCDLVRFRTPNPPGGNEAAAQDFVEERMTALGLEVDRWDALPGRPNVVGRMAGRGGGRSVVLNGHIDVCEERRLDQWSTTPYEPVVTSDEVVGRGTSDMKGGLASFLVALEVLRSRQIELSGDVTLHSVIGEEAGEPGTRAAIARGHRGDFAIVGEPTRSRALVACVGVLTCRIVVRATTSQHLATKRLQGVNCVDRMALAVLPALEELSQDWQASKAHPLVPPGSALVNVFRIEGGSTPFMLPDRCAAYTTVSYLPDEDPQDVMRELEDRVVAAAALDPWLCDHPPLVEWSPAEFPIEFASCDLAVDTEAMAVLRDAIAAASGRTPELGGRGGITDAGWFARQGIPAVVFGPGDQTQAHGVDERIRIEDLVDHCKAIGLFLVRYCGPAGVARVAAA
jgi:formylaminopyrimidine deformylase